MSAQDLEPVAWITPESIRHLAKMNGPANVVVWNCASGNARVPLYAAPQPHQPAPVVDDAMVERAAIALSNFDRPHPFPEDFWAWRSEDSRDKYRGRARAALAQGVQS